MTQSSQVKDSFSAAVRIWQSDGAKPIGMGFLVDDQHVMTCAHVVGDALGNRDWGSLPTSPGGPVGVDFPVANTSRSTHVARSVPTYWRPRGGELPDDIAVIRLDSPESLPPECGPIRALRSIKSARAITAYVVKNDIPEGTYIDCKVRGPVAGGRYEVAAEREAEAVAPGCSGGAAWSPDGALAGMVVSMHTTVQGLVIPVEYLRTVWPAFLDITTRVPFMAPDLPTDFVERTREFNQLRTSLLESERGNRLAITTALRGAGGFGKTTLSIALCHDDDVIAAFRDGILWVTLGEKPGDLTTKLVDLIEVLSGGRPGFKSEEAAVTRLKELLADRDILMVIDDAWNAAHVTPFLQGGKRCARLITTRNLEAVPAGTKRVNVDAMRLDEALQVLSAGLPLGLDSQLRRLAARLGEWPLLLRLVNGALRERTDPEGPKQPLAEALVSINEDLDENGLTAFDSKDPVERAQAVATTVAVSLKQLGPDQQRFEELAIFPEDLDIPLATVGQLWKTTARVSSINAEKLCQRLHRLSLLLQFDLGRRVIRLHDVMRTYLRGQLADLAAVHARLIDAWGNSHELPDDYAWRRIAYHLAETGREQQLRSLLLDFNWLQAKLDKTDITALISDYDHLLTPANSVVAYGIRPKRLPSVPVEAPGEPIGIPPWRYVAQDFGVQLADLKGGATNDSLSLVQDAMRLSAHVLTKEPAQLASQLWGRLVGEDREKIQALLQRAKQTRTGFWFRPLTASLIRPGEALLSKLIGHSDYVFSLVLSRDGSMAVSGSGDCTLRVWDMTTAEERCKLQDSSTALAITPDGRTILSGSIDHSVGIWDSHQGKRRVAFTGHTERINAVAATPDGRWAISASEDGTLRVWDIPVRVLLYTFAGHDVPVNAVAITPDGQKAVSGSKDGTLKVWGLTSGRLLHTLGTPGWREGKTITLPNGGTGVYFRDGNSPAVWDGRQLLRRFAGHIEEVTALAVTPDSRRAVSGSRDATLRVWDLETGAEERVLIGHKEYIYAVAVSPNGQLAASASSDRTVRIWDLEVGSCLHCFEGHDLDVFCLAFTPDGRGIVTGSGDETVRFWGLERGEERACLRGHTGASR